RSWPPLRRHGLPRPLPASRRRAATVGCHRYGHCARAPYSWALLVGLFSRCIVQSSSTLFVDTLGTGASLREIIYLSKRKLDNFMEPKKMISSLRRLKRVESSEVQLAEFCLEADPPTKDEEKDAYVK